MRPARRIGELRPSPIRLLSEGASPEAMPLGLGEPSWELPAAARRALAASRGACGYGPNAGLPDLRRAIAERHGVRDEEVLVTAGAEGALYSLFQAWLDPGDQVLVPDPGYPAYRALARLAEAEAVPYALDAAHGWRLDAVAFERALEAHPAARVAVLNHPSNPTGGGASREALAAVARVCEAREILLVSDEVYRELHFGQAVPSLRELSPSGVVLESVSKGWAAPGLRVGWAVGDPRWLAPARTVHAFAVTAAPEPCQRAALALLEDAPSILEASRRELACRWEALDEACRHHLGACPSRPDGSFYHWMPLPAGAGEDPLAFCVRLRDEAGVVLVPGFTFGEAGRRHLRLSFGATPGQVAEGVRRLAPFWRMA